MPEPAAKLDPRFSEATAPTPWADAEGALARAELYWITTVRADGRPHVTPLIGLFDGAFHFTTGLREQKARNLEANRNVAVTTGTNAWAKGLDVVLEGEAARVSDRAELQRIADAYVEKYGEVWRFEVGDGVFGEGETAAALFRVVPAKVLAFGKDPHGQTTYRF